MDDRNPLRTHVLQEQGKLVDDAYNTWKGTPAWSMLSVSPQEAIASAERWLHDLGAEIKVVEYPLAPARQVARVLATACELRDAFRQIWLALRGSDREESEGLMLDAMSALDILIMRVEHDTELLGEAPLWSKDAGRQDVSGAPFHSAALSPYRSSPVRALETAVLYYFRGV
ncbi:MAG: hypothetical protein ACR2RB_04775 [Gammaproteobacteria bacterium]